jgi:hypothetical protein
MVFGFFEKNGIKAVCDKEAYGKGDLITCLCTLKLNGPTKARGLRVEFFRLAGNDYEPILVETREIGGARFYVDGEKFKVCFNVNEKAFSAKPKPGNIDNIVESAIANNRSKPTGWRLRFSLDVPNSKDVNGVINLEINPPSI